MSCVPFLTFTANIYTYKKYYKSPKLYVIPFYGVISSSLFGDDRKHTALHYLNSC